MENLFLSKKNPKAAEKTVTAHRKFNRVKPSHFFAKLGPFIAKVRHFIAKLSNFIAKCLRLLTYIDYSPSVKDI